MRNSIKLIVALLFMIPFGAMAQNFPMDEETNRITYTAVVEIDSVNKDQLFDRAKTWLMTKTDNHKIEKANKEVGTMEDDVKVIIQLTYDFKYKKNCHVTMHANISVKEGRYKYVLDNFRIYDEKSGVKTEQTLEAYYTKQRHNAKPELVNNTDAQVKALIEDLVNKMAKAKSNDQDDW
jgi:hypothetical protein